MTMVFSLFKLSTNLTFLENKGRSHTCFGEQGSFAGSKCLMSLETGEMAIDHLLKNSGTRKNLEIDFFGGEPLMNFDTVKQLVDYGRKEEKKYDFLVLSVRYSTN